MVQGLPKRKRIDQGLALSVFASQPFQVFAFDPEGGYAFGVVLYPDAGKGASPGKKKRPDEDVGCFYALGHWITSFPKSLKNLSSKISTKNIHFQLNT
jgi:hypothetical protein